MPKSKRMARREKPNDDASEALLDSMTADGDRKEKRDARNDDPFVDEDGDLHVVPTFEDLSSLLDDASVHALPMTEILRRNLRVTLRATEMAEIAYHANPRQGTATALTQMQNLTKDLIKAIEERQDPAVLRDEIAELVLKPLVYEFIKVLTSEAEKKRAALMSIVSPEMAGVVQHEMSDLLKGVASGADEALEDCKRILDEMLGAKFKGK
ncbi:hypothetical protein LCGC14_2937000 [marine sediment metagenome]|uniref:Uncharacterized protein n=1 Tax=marine sediment metagenome TaxID=412755 RepID=A0A0F8XJ49_9ZZZZ